MSKRCVLCQFYDPDTFTCHVNPPKVVASSKGSTSTEYPSLPPNNIACGRFKEESGTRDLNEIIRRYNTCGSEIQRNAALPVTKFEDPAEAEFEKNKKKLLSQCDGWAGNYDNSKHTLLGMLGSLINK